MLKFISHLFAAKKPAPAKPRPTTRLRCEGLEDRSCPSISYGAEGVVSSAFAQGNYQANASSANGSKVVVWATATASSDIYAQRYDAAGAKVGGIIAVTATPYQEGAPDVAMDADGGFVVVWQYWTPGTDTSTALFGVRAARYSAAGEAKGTQMVAGGSTYADQAYDPSVAVAANGDYVVAYDRMTMPNWPGNASSEWDVYYRAYQANGVPKQAATAVAAVSWVAETNPAVAMASDGRFAIAYESDTNSNLTPSQVRLREYSPSLAPVQTSGLVVNATPDKAYQPDLAMGDDGRCLVVWRSEDSADTGGLRGRRVDSTGTLLGQELELGVGCNPHVAIHPTRYQAVVTFVSNGHLYSREVDGSGQFYASTDLGITSSPGAVSVDGTGKIFITFDSGSDIRCRLGQFIAPRVSGYQPITGVTVAS